MQWAWAKDERYVPAFLWTIHLIVFGSLLGVVIFLTSCGQQPTFTTMQGIDVYVESGLADKDTFDCAIGATFGERRETDIVVDAGMSIFVTAEKLGYVDDREVGAYVIDYRDIKLHSTEPEHVGAIPHEIGHIAHYLLYKNPDWEHSDPTFFGATSFDNNAKNIILRSCIK